MLPLQGAWVQSLVAKLRSCMPHGTAKKKKKEEMFRKIGLGYLTLGTRLSFLNKLIEYFSNSSQMFQENDY